ncbi:NUDIX hydrolase [Pseudomonas aeruginosa]|uniref:NUDIX hydrolase n=1 Tax=Pseudomonas aeruginosa TaxID=287 RepID=UPI001AAE6740|nr:NUDIX hydrolase [Pseudomonas aeruginosa]MBO2834814.1 NUDIX hydrolase [Pseudomonas aeruginosa]
MTWNISKATAYGGVLLTRSGQILLREPSNHFAGYVWTFAKGTPEPGDTPEMTALREVREETGYEVEIVDVLPGLFKGGLSTNAYFVMRHIGPQGEFDWETQATRWVDFDQAAELIGLTKNFTGRLRDLAVLAAARQWFEKNGSNLMDD